MALTTTQIVALFGAYYIAGGQGTKDLLKKIYQKSETDELFQLVRTTDTVLRKGKLQIGGVLQAFQKQFTPMGNTTVTGRQIDLYPLKVDVSEYPDDVFRSWVGFLANDDLKRKNWPFVKYWLEELVANQMIEDWELTAVFAGVKANVVAGTALPAASSINGIKKLLNIEIAAGNTTPVETGALETDPVAFVEQMEAWAKGGIPMKYRPYLQTIAFSPTLEERFKTGMRTKYQQYYAQAGDLLTIMDTSMKVKGYASHEGSDKIWTTIKGNAVMGIRKPGNESIFEVENIDRLVKAYTDFDKGLGYWEPNLIYTNELELT